MQVQKDYRHMIGDLGVGAHWCHSGILDHLQHLDARTGPKASSLFQNTDLPADCTTLCLLCSSKSSWKVVLIVTYRISVWVFSWADVGRTEVSRMLASATCFQTSSNTDLRFTETCNTKSFCLHRTTAFLKPFSSSSDACWRTECLIESLEICHCMQKKWSKESRVYKCVKRFSTTVVDTHGIISLISDTTAIVYSCNFILA